MADTLPAMKIKTAKQKRIICTIAFFLVDLVAPMLIIGFHFKLFTHFNGFKLTIMGVFLLIILLFKFRNKIITRVEKWEYSIAKYVILGLNKVIVFIIIAIIAHLAVIGLQDVVYCVDWIMVCSIIAYIVIQPIEERYSAIVKRELRKAELKEAMDEREKEGDKS